MERIVFVFRRVIARTRRPATAVFTAIYAGSAFYMLHRLITGYVHSSFLSQFMTEKTIGLVFSTASILALLTFFIFAKLLRKVGAHRFFLLISLVAIFATSLISITTTPVFAVALFITITIASQLLYYIFDVFIELYSRSETETGRVRGTYLTILTTSAIAASLLMGLLVGDNEYWKGYLAAAIFLVPMVFLIGRATKNPPPFIRSEQAELLSTIRSIVANRNLRIILFLHFLLQLAFVWFVVYIPLYLTQYIGFDWLTFGTLLSIGFLGYIITEYPAGWIADNILGEKELLATGFIILSGTLIAMSFITVASFGIWVFVFLLSRAGAGLVESMSESYFFKQVDGSDTTTMALFRMLRPLATITGPILVTLLLIYFPFQYIFVFCGIFILFFGLIGTLRLVDSR